MRPGEYPKPQDTCEWRVIGPAPNRHGMPVWCVYEVNTGRRYGPEFMTLYDAMDYADDLTRGRRVFWFGGTKFKRHDLARHVVDGRGTGQRPEE
jgi:hypothetical protein